MSSTSSFEPITLLYAFEATVQVLLILIPGVYYAYKGVVDKKVRKTLSAVSFNVVLPALCFYSIALRVTADTIASYWPFIASTVLSKFLGIGIGYFTNWLTGTPWHLQHHVITASAFGNNNSLPLILVAALCTMSSLPFAQYLGTQCSAAGYGYVAVSTAFGRLFSYPIAIYLLKERREPRAESRSLIKSLKNATQAIMSGVTRRSLPTDAPSQKDATEIPEGNECQVERGMSSSVPLQGDAIDDQQSNLAVVPITNSNGEAPPAMGVDMDKQSSQAGVTSEDRIDPNFEDSDYPPVYKSERTLFELEKDVAPKKKNFVVLTGLWLYKVIRIFVDDMVKPPQIMTGLGILVGTVPALRNLFYPKPYDTCSGQLPNTPPLWFITGAIYQVQNSLVFVVSFVLGAALGKGPGPATRTVGWKTCAMVVVNRYIILPFIGMILIIGTYKLGWWTSLDPVYIFVLFTQYNMPTANQMQNIAAMYDNYDKEMAAMIFWQYIAALVFFPAWTTIYIYAMDKWDLYPPLPSPAPAPSPE